MEYDKRTVSKLGMICVFGCVYLLSALIGSSTTVIASSNTIKKECIHIDKKEEEITITNTDNDNDNKRYPIQSFFVKTSDVKANEMAHQFAQYGHYHNYLTVKQIKSKFCLGYCVVLRVSTDDTKFFNRKNAVWPSRPEVDWVSDALRDQLKDVYYIRFESYAEPPPTSLNDGSIDQYEETSKVIINLDDETKENNNNSDDTTQ